jgi:hypothetical protein
MRSRPHTTARLYRWVRPKRDPMANVTETEMHENETENDDEEEEEVEPGNGDGDSLLESWETENALIFELHGFGDHDEIIVFEEKDEEEEPVRKKPEKPEDTDDVSVALALNIEDLDEAIEIMKEIRVKMVERENARKKARLQAKAKS